ncbi:hypothetical protein GO730_05885 [Spirosoma sp. HMF3257]|uniref:Uncharacterized protein n=1 Tax=Spirosoma telluris TaxID=2183553 RepID=A0A327NJ16_9BACT|nr:hypothetical protein [Spirosoma telluris]RAI74006.1 hypothetical protein HMF3257_05840 [Spirosoma telluris]
MNDKTKHLQAVCQLAEMEHNADPEHPVKKQKFESAKADFEQALAEVEPTEPEAAEPATGGNQWPGASLEILSNVVEAMDKANQALTTENKALANENALLKEQLFEKSQELEKAQKSTAPAESDPAAKPATAKPATAADEKKN